VRKPTIGLPRWKDLDVAKGTPWRFVPRLDGVVYAGITAGGDRVEYLGETLTFNQMGRRTTGWPSCCVYDYIQFQIGGRWVGAQALRGTAAAKRAVG
jgi:hypothetical protein